MNADEAPLVPTDAEQTDTGSESGSDSGQPVKSGRTLAGVAVLFALPALAASGWLWWSEYRSRDEAAARQAAETGRVEQLEKSLDERLQQIVRRVGALESAAGDDRVASLDDRVATLEERAQVREADMRKADSFRAEMRSTTRSLQASVDNLDARLAGLDTRIDRLGQGGLNGPAELDLAELDYLLRFAQERLQLFTDIRGAERALQLAGDQVDAFDSPVFTGLAQQIDTARQALATVDLPDTATLERELAAAQDRVAELPFRGEGATDRAAAEVGGGGGWWARLKAGLSSLVTVRRSTDEERLPALADQALIRQRAWLEFERARLAAARHDDTAYQAALQAARTTVQRWFAAQHRGTRAVLQALESAAAIDVDPDLPDISGPWQALQALRARGVAAPAAADRADGS